VTNGTLNAVVAAISVTAEREEAMDFTQPFFTTGLGIAVSDKTTRRGWRAATSGVLAVSGGDQPAGTGAVGGGFLMWLFERRGNAEQFGGKPLQGIGAGFWWSAVTMTTVAMATRRRERSAGGLSG